jgi:hypothetical protein
VTTPGYRWIIELDGKANMDAFPPDGDAVSWNQQIADPAGAPLPETAYARLIAAVRAKASPKLGALLSAKALRRR